jgi:uncharacterized protein
MTADRDWTAGEAAILFQACAACRTVWYFRRSFCPHCGSPEPNAERASGRGTVAAATIVHRAPSPALRAFAPYCIVLVDAEEGFRMMARGDRLLAVGDRVSVRFIPFGDGIVPYFERYER